MDEVEGVTIHVHWSEMNEAYAYDVYMGAVNPADMGESEDGGQCDGTYADAIEMASQAAQTLIAKR